MMNVEMNVEMNIEMNIETEMNVERVAEDVVFMNEGNMEVEEVECGGVEEVECGGVDEVECGGLGAGAVDNCPICLETLNSTNIETIHGCGHKFCVDCVKVLRDRCDTYDSEGLGVKVVKCPMCRGTEAVSAEQLKKRVRELCTQKNLLAFEADDLRTKCKNMEKAFATIRKALPKTRDVNRAQRVRPGIDEAVEFAVREREEIRRRRLDVERRLGFVGQQPAVGQQPTVGQPVVRPAIRRPRLGRRGEELGFCVVVGCRSKNRTVRLCDSCAEFCCARCKKCSTCRSFL